MKGRSVRVASQDIATTRRTPCQRVLIALTLLSVLNATLGTGFFPATLTLAKPDRAALQGDDTPTPAASAPRNDPVSSTDDTMVRPEDTVAGPNDACPGSVSGRPASGVGFTVSADHDVRRWTNLAVTAPGITTVILSGVTIWSLLRRVERFTLSPPRLARKTYERVAVAGRDPFKLRCRSTNHPLAGQVARGRRGGPAGRAVAEWSGGDLIQR